MACQVCPVVPIECASAAEPLDRSLSRAIRMREAPKDRPAGVFAVTRRVTGFRDRDFWAIHVAADWTRPSRVGTVR